MAEFNKIKQICVHECYHDDSHKSVEEFFLNYKDNNKIGEIDLNDEIIKLISNKMMTCIDVGAHLGRYSESLLSINACNKILAYEPDDVIRGKMIEKFKDNDKVEISSSVVYFEETDLTFYSCSDEQASIDQKNTFNNCPGTVKKTISLQNIINNHNPTYVKIDTEGFDDVIISSVKFWGKVNFIYFEYNDKWFWKSGNKMTLQEVIYKLSDEFNCYFVGSKLISLMKWISSFEIKRWSNVFCIRKQYVLNVNIS